MRKGVITIISLLLISNLAISQIQLRYELKNNTLEINPIDTIDLGSVLIDETDTVQVTIVNSSTKYQYASINRGGNSTVGGLTITNQSGFCAFESGFEGDINQQTGLVVGDSISSSLVFAPKQSYQFSEWNNGGTNCTQSSTEYTGIGEYESLFFVNFEDDFGNYKSFRIIIQASGTEIVSSINDVFNRNELVIYPNPASDAITINTKDLNYVVITNLEGSVLIESTEAKINVNELNNGIYFATVHTNNGIRTITFMKN